MSKTDLGYDSEKLGVPPAFPPVSSSTSRVEEDPTLFEAEETLHRGLKARQISMIVFLINLLGIRFFGELEFWMSSIKVLALIGLILFGLICDLGGNPRHDRVGFRYWSDLFAYMGTELIGVTVGEAENPRKNIPRAIRRTFWRILIFYVGGVFVIGLIVPSNDPNLFTATKAKTGAAASPFVVAAKNFAIRGLDHVINSAILRMQLPSLDDGQVKLTTVNTPVFVLSAANSDLYIGSRTLYALAAEGKAPAIFKRVNRMGVPYPALIFCTAFCCLVYLNVQATSAQVFNYFVSLVTFFGATTWMCIVYSHIRFMKALEVQSIPRSSLPYRAPFQPYGSYFALVITGIITFFKGYKLMYRTRVIPPAEVDLVSGKRQIDEEEELYLAKQEARGPRTRWQKIWDSL
ncbi:hypothetical protein FRC00_005554 [Tulasnella sp. 408]|nr:hypothetical protein FRC00_005554 [Tulasnella sp. 408]